MQKLRFRSPIYRTCLKALCDFHRMIMINCAITFSRIQKLHLGVIFVCNINDVLSMNRFTVLIHSAFLAACSTISCKWHKGDAAIIMLGVIIAISLATLLVMIFIKLYQVRFKIDTIPVCLKIYLLASDVLIRSSTINHFDHYLTNVSGHSET